MLTPAQRDQIVSILDAAADLTIATNRPDGYPQATTVSFVNDGDKIYFGTGAKAQKAQNIARDDRISIAITDPYRTWDDIRGVSIGGRARRVTEPEELQRVGELMFKKFPQISRYAEFGAGTELALFRIDPRVISILDYSQGFGHTERATA
ncbi:MAG TPA: pyridoxamine 5'-phosphate oxidase family protein [Vitreimonas sp.]|jgi:nitroimidazol reductase NimA-like FMN-containing flavoprotein (pyridoxamine 5'-phosphate oxidase superfamily)|nr:pyridoxamine 5'-phosphate oxidase family protein [Vitreimonas sp.]